MLVIRMGQIAAKDPTPALLLGMFRLWKGCNTQRLEFPGSVSRESALWESIMRLLFVPVHAKIDVPQVSPTWIGPMDNTRSYWHPSTLRGTNLLNENFVSQWTLGEWKESRWRIRTNTYNREPRSTFDLFLGRTIRSKWMLPPACTGHLPLAAPSPILALLSLFAYPRSLWWGPWDRRSPRIRHPNVVRAGACCPKTDIDSRCHRQRGPLGKIRPRVVGHCPSVDVIGFHHSDQWCRLSLVHHWSLPLWYLQDQLNDPTTDSPPQCRWMRYRSRTIALPTGHEMRIAKYVEVWESETRNFDVSYEIILGGRKNQTSGSGSGRGHGLTGAYPSSCFISRILSRPQRVWNQRIQNCFLLRILSLEAIITHQVYLEPIFWLS